DRLPPVRILCDGRMSAAPVPLAEQGRKPEAGLQNGVALDRLFREAPCLVSAIFIELNDFDGPKPGARVHQSREYCVRLARRLQERVQAARAVDAAFSGADKQRTEPQPRLRLRRVRTLAALV